jgi:hypothetical protein
MTVNPFNNPTYEKMKQNTLIHTVIKPSIVLAVAVLTAASFLARSTANAEDATYLMPTGRGGGHTDDGIQPFDPNPAGPGFEYPAVFDVRGRCGWQRGPFEDSEDHEQHRGHSVSDHAGSELETPRD